MLLISREWIVPLCQIFGRQAGMVDNLALHETGITGMHTSVKLLTLAPWHFRLLVGSLEAIASLWGQGFRLYYRKTTTPLTELQAFEKLPLISAPLLRIYRHLAALAWFEHPLVLAHFGIYEKAEMKQISFHEMHNQVA